jgi:hypothetical protein
LHILVSCDGSMYASCWRLHNVSIKYIAIANILEVKVENIVQGVTKRTSRDTHLQ